MIKDRLSFTSWHKKFEIRNCCSGMPSVDENILFLGVLLTGRINDFNFAVKFRIRQKYIKSFIFSDHLIFVPKAEPLKLTRLEKGV